MLVNADGAVPAVKPDLREVTRRARALAQELADVRRQAGECDADLRAARRTEESAFKSDQIRKENHLRAEIDVSRARVAAWSTRREELIAERRARLDRAATRARAHVVEVLRREQRRRDAEVEEAAKALDAEARRETVPLSERLHRWETLQGEVGKEAAATLQAVSAFADRYGGMPGAVDEPAGDLDVEADPDATAAQVRTVFGEVHTGIARAERFWAAELARTGPVVMFHLLLLVLGAGAIYLAIELGAERREAAPVLGAVLGLTVLLQVAARLVRGKYHRQVDALHVRAVGEARRFERHSEAAMKHLEARLLAVSELQATRLRGAEEQAEGAYRTRTAKERRQEEWLAQRREGAESRLAGRLGIRGRNLEQREALLRTSREQAAEAERAQDLAGHRERMKKIEDDGAERQRLLQERRGAALAEFHRFAEAVDAVARRGPPAWEAIDPARYELPTAFPEFVVLGRLRLTIDALLGAPGDAGDGPREWRLPVAATFPGHGALLVQHGPADRVRAHELLSAALLRTLVTFPAGKVRLTIIDPVGLGQGFSSLMHLADHDEALVNSRIWTESAHIERRLAELTEHVEKVIQKYLRNRYETIGEYNVEAGDLQEPYHFLVIADFPTGFNDIAAERLASLIHSGPRCGVYTFIAHDTRQALPPPLDAALLALNGPAVQFHRDGPRLAEEPLSRGDLELTAAPAPDYVIALLDRIGRMSVAASKVELPFSAVTPGDDGVWTGSTLTGIRVPIGRTGAERLQFLDLGHGTAQHALVAGRTGSGKSTLFHVMITNMALWFSPDEIQFYLIDFKKGVEFKVFATGRLPHARVVAIESDREFGLSVLRALDVELARRGDLFRAAGVQDLASYRRRGAGEALPRTVLLIDEFQEFFTDDDAVAHDAAVLLDRFVRQGRAFGIHVVLGSQTLSGIYTLARGTLGQMGVRIALQCNEADSYLILSEDNGVARLLSRPGEAIYNDKSGLVEGNNPFQIVWLTDEEQRRRLRLLADRAEALPPAGRRETVVFEGNQPADILSNSELVAMSAKRRPVADTTDRIFIGEPNAIKGPTEVRFGPLSGSNLLVTGQNRDGAFAILSSAVLSLSARYRPGEVRILILDGGGHEPEFFGHFENLLAAVPHHLERHDLRTAADAVAEVAALLASREAGSDGQPPMYLFAFGLQRLRMLRQEDDFATRFTEEPKESPGEQFARILTEGPARRIHTIIWCDTVPNLQRTLSRRVQKEFDNRVLFQMSAADSSEMIESAAANRLGLTNALLSVESLGTFEKFRPYAIPSAEVMRRVGGGRGG